MIALPLLLALTTQGPAPPTPATPTTWPAGTWRLDVVVVVGADVPVLGRQTTTTTSISVVDVDGAGNAIARACRVETSGPGFTSFMPPSSLRKLPLTRFAIVVDGKTMRADLGEGQIGYRGAGPIPEKADDPRVFDLDGDGKPGVRMQLDLGALGEWTLQVVNRGHTEIAGVIDAAGNAAGTPTRLESDERVLSGLPVGMPERKEPIDPARSRFKLVRLVDDDRSFCR
ncbi:MAG TPA: hypothetical protein VGF99_10930, partial [Myxococcota bacterium]